MSQINRPMGAADWGRLIFLSVLWGGSFYFVGVAVSALPPLTIVMARLVLAALALNLLLRLRGDSLPGGWRVWRALAGMGLINNVIPFSLIVWGQTQLPSGVAAILNATTPLFTVIVAHHLTQDEKMTGGRLLGVVLGLGGVAGMIGSGALEQLGTAQIPAQLACLAAALSYGFSATYGRRLRGLGIAPLAIAAGQLSCSALLMLPLALLAERPWTLPPPPLPVIAAVLALALLSTALAYILYFRILEAAGATNLSLVTFLIPVTSITLGVTLLDEPIAGRHLFGIALIGAGLAAIDGRVWRWLSRRHTPR